MILAFLIMWLISLRTLSCMVSFSVAEYIVGVCTWRDTWNKLEITEIVSPFDDLIELNIDQCRRAS